MELDAVELSREPVAIQSINPGGNEPTVILGPGDTHMAHQTDEFCVASRILVAVEMYEALIRDWMEEAS